MLIIWRADWWGMFRAALLIAVLAIFSFPKASGSNVESEAEFHTSDDVRHVSNPDAPSKRQLGKSGTTK